MVGRLLPLGPANPATASGEPSPLRARPRTTSALCRAGPGTPPLPWPIAHSELNTMRWAVYSEKTRMRTNGRIQMCGAVPLGGEIGTRSFSGTPIPGCSGQQRFAERSHVWTLGREHVQLLQPLLVEDRTQELANIA